MLDIAQFAVFNSTPFTSSSDATSMRFLNISLDANRRICPADSDIVGAVMIHGTNTLAETVGCRRARQGVVHTDACVGIWY